MGGEMCVRGWEGRGGDVFEVRVMVGRGGGWGGWYCIYLGNPNTR